MRPALRYLPAFLTLLVPLSLVGWLGHSELQRQGDLALEAFRQQALTRLQEAKVRFEEEVHQRAAHLLDGIDLAAASPVVVARELIEREDRVLDLFLLKPTGELEFPRPPEPQAATLLFAKAPRAPELRAADVLEVNGDIEGAAGLLARYCEAQDAADEDLARARFQLAGIRRRQGDRAAAEQLYLSSWAPLDLEDPDAPALRLLAEVAVAEMGNDPAVLLDLATRISEGDHPEVGDELIDSVLERLLQRIPADASQHARVRDVWVSERVRLSGRRFAVEYQAFMAETVNRGLMRSGRPKDAVSYHYFTVGSVPSLLVVRQATTRQQLQYSSLAQWIGLRLDLALMVNDILDRFLPSESGTATFSLQVLDPDGESILPGHAGNGDAGLFDLPVVPTDIGNLRLRAIPTDAGAFLEQQRASSRNRTLLLLALCAVAAGGGLFLVRSASREAELARLKMEFVSRVSHELKTPLSLIKMYGETLGMGRARDREQSARFAGVISREADRLTHLIDRILDFSRNEAGTMRYDPRRVELAPVVQRTVDGYRPQAESRGIDLTVAVVPGLVADVDARALEGSLLNLIENSSKYTPESAPERTVEVVLEPAPGGTQAVLEVRDRGIGIPAAEQERVFQSFYRASNAGEVRGAGLGLSLVRHFARAHGGTIRVHARPGGGTIMRMLLPLASAVATAPVAPAASAPMHDSAADHPPAPARDRNAAPPPDRLPLA